MVIKIKSQIEKTKTQSKDYKYTKKNKKMKSIIFLLIPIYSLAQSINFDILNRDYKYALELHNNIRKYHEYPILKYSKELSEEAKKYQLNGDKNIEKALIYYVDKNQYSLRYDYFTDAIIAWTVDRSMEFSKESLNQVLCKKCLEIGFSIKEEDGLILVVVKYDNY